MDDSHEVPAIDVHEAKRRAEQGTLFLDVREDHEFSQSRIPGTVLIPLSEFVERFEELPKDKQILIHCRSGHRSSDATTFLNQRGYDAINVAGGILSWDEEGLPVEPGDDQ
jgi:rhodanese-related sulfurtransferase